ncbi:hypothetical protein F5141DRAFT_4069 [Pisolithus sp. B1]|nr:hypothetical protein F5141DRAFT_4069 [Pisolithus sp. B1]
MNSLDDVSHKRAKLKRHPLGHDGRAVALTDLAKALHDRFQKVAVVADLEEAITLAREALELRPSGHPDRSISLNNLACVLKDRSQKQATMPDLEEAIKLFREALELRPSGHPDRPSSLRHLSVCLSNRYDVMRITTDLEESVSLGRAALELCPPGHSDRGTSLNNLAYCLMGRFQKHAAIQDLEEAIELYREALELRSSGHIDRSSSFHNLAFCLSMRYDDKRVAADLEEAVTLGRAALQLRPAGHPERGISISNLACDLRRKFWMQAEMPDILEEAIELHRAALELRPSGHSDQLSLLHNLSACLLDRYTSQKAATDLEEALTFVCAALELCPPGRPDHGAILKLAEHGVKLAIRYIIPATIPTRLLHTLTGTLCDLEAQISHFTSSQQYNQLLSSCTTCEQDQRMELIHANVSEYFQYAMFSHRWGEGEPSLRDVEGQPIYDMSDTGGFGKLQGFCLAAREEGYMWAWSDTCCIDKDSIFELRRTIGSMFGWYRQSALTIVYLSDVPDTGSFESSEWFRRGWTLQELLAPPRLLFYSKDWSLYKNLTSPNHKTDAAILAELEKATGIDSRTLTDFSPGMTDVRSRLQWASSRRTTRPEDIAYSLFGIFDLNLPVLYGEGDNDALGRLLAAIISQFGDISVLDWVGEASSFNSCFPAHITFYQTLPSPLAPRSDAEEHTLLMGQQPPPSSAALQKLLHSLTEPPLPQILGQRLKLPCIAYHVTAIQLKTADQHASSYTYEVQAAGLRRLEITLRSELENVTMSPDALRLVRPWHRCLLGPPTQLYTTAEEQLFNTLGMPFNALLLTQTHHDSYKRIASSTLITAQPTDTASILQSEVEVLEVV